MLICILSSNVLICCILSNYNNIDNNYCTDSYLINYDRILL